MTRATLPLLALALAAMSPAAGLTFASSSFANNGATRTSFLNATGITTPEYLVDFESFAVGDNLNGDLLPGGLVYTTNSTSATNGGVVQSDPNFFGTSNPIGTKALSILESATNVVTFTTPVDYFGGILIDVNGSPITVTYVGGATQTFNVGQSGSTGNTGVFFGIFRNDQPQILSVNINAQGGDGEAGLDNFEYGVVQPVPEPATMAALGLGALALLRRRARRA